MCFSATASFTAAAGLSAAGVVTLRQAKDRASRPLAAMPLLFGAQQAVEGVIWVTGGYPGLRAAAASLYVFFSHIFWPTYVPLAVIAIEPPGPRRTILKGFSLFGVALSVWLASFIVRGPVTADPTCCGIVYNLNVPSVPYGLAAYVFVTCFSCFVSSHKFIRVFGVTLMGSLAIALWSHREAFYSVWCFFAAILSLIIYAHLRGDRPLWPRAAARQP